MTYEEIEPISAIRKKKKIDWQANLSEAVQVGTRAIVADFAKLSKVVNENLASVRKEHNEESVLQSRKLQILQKNYLHWCTSCLLPPSSLLPSLHPRSINLLSPSTNLG